MALKEVSPIEEAIEVIESSIKELQLKKQRLLSLLPQEPVSKRRTKVFFNHRTGKIEKFDAISGEKI